MKNSEAINIFFHLKDDRYSTEEKGTAIFKIMTLKTHMGFSKKSIAAAIEWIARVVMQFVDSETMSRSRAKQILIAAPYCQDYSNETILNAVMTMLYTNTYLYLLKDQMIDILRLVWNMCFEMDCESE